jgi:hypothetical protein
MLCLTEIKHRNSVSVLQIVAGRDSVLDVGPAAVHRRASHVPDIARRLGSANEFNVLGTKAATGVPEVSRSRLSFNEASAFFFSPLPHRTSQPKNGLPQCRCLTSTSARCIRNSQSRARLLAGCHELNSGNESLAQVISLASARRSNLPRGDDDP